ncbi:hypothetical protein ARMSODRAFT_430883 [Armillaria solidipes]|uniref:Uncharacterized protein n=1 Tax=Armillaria solidipes TaxID=1076256 RepID=A0A2H3BRD8_9AGAR|nr:hypothetical protein ARMSODRAFT_430883 [Armillaria solidipes]
MLPSTCMLNGNLSSVTISLEHARSTSKTTTGVSTISLVTSRGSYEARVSLVKTTDGPFDVCLGLDWFIALLKGDPDGGLVPFQLESLRSAYRLFCLPESPSFFTRLSFDSLLYELAAHGILHKTSCGQDHLYLNLLVEHFLSGMCSSLNGPSCRSYVQACHTGRVRPPAFFLSVLRYTNLLTVLPSSALLPFWRFLAPSTRENKRERAIDGLAARLTLVRYLSYKGSVTYMAAVFDGHFETLPRKDLLRMADAHGLSARSAHFSLDDLRDTISDHVFGGGCAGWLSHSIANIPESKQAVVVPVRTLDVS